MERIIAGTRTKRNELTEVKLEKATSLLQKGVQDTGLSEILVNLEVHEKRKGAWSQSLCCPLGRFGG